MTRPSTCSERRASPAPEHVSCSPLTLRRRPPPAAAGASETGNALDPFAEEREIPDTNFRGKQHLLMGPKFISMRARVGAVADADDHDVALVSPDVLEVLHEEADVLPLLLAIHLGLDTRAELGVLLSELANGLLDLPLLRFGERDDTQGEPRVLREQAAEHVRHVPSLADVAPALVRRVLHLVEAHRALEQVHCAHRAVGRFSGHDRRALRGAPLGRHGPELPVVENGSLRMRIHQIKCRTVCSALPGERAVYAARGVLRAFLTLWVGESGTMYRRFAH